MSFLSIITRAVAAAIAFFRRSTLRRSKSPRHSENYKRVNLGSIEAGPPVAAGHQDPVLDLNDVQGADSRSSLLEGARADPYSAEESVATPGAISSRVNGGQPSNSGEVEDREASHENAAGLATQSGLSWCAADADHEKSEYEEQNAVRDSKTTSLSPSLFEAHDGPEARESLQAILPSALLAEMAGDTTRPQARAAALAPNSVPILGTDAVLEVRDGSPALSAAIQEIESVREDAVCVVPGGEGAAKANILSNGATTELPEDQSKQIAPNFALRNDAGPVDVRDGVRLREAEYAPAESWVGAGESVSALVSATAANSADNLVLSERDADIGIPEPSDLVIAGNALAEDPRGGISENGAFTGVASERQDRESNNEPSLAAQSLHEIQTLPDGIPLNHAQAADDFHIDADANAGVALESIGDAISDQPPKGPQIERRDTGGNRRSVGPAATKPSRRVSAYRDRRGERRAPLPSEEPPTSRSSSETAAPSKPGELKLRLSLSPIRRTAVLSIYLNRPEGFGERIALGSDNFCGEQLVQAYDQRRYDDIDVSWTPQLLDGELRAKSLDGYQWLRSSRRVHLFAEDLAEPGLISVGGATRGVLHAVVCRAADVAAVSEIAASTGSPQLVSHPNWLGVPEGWAVLSGFRPMHEATIPVGSALNSLDPMAAIEIRFDGLGLRDRVFAEGRPPRILISELPEGARVTIGDQPASICADGGWDAPGWDAPGARVVDVVPGPSASYEIVQDPWRADGWTFWDAHPERFGQDALALPWAEAEICGALVRAPGGREIIAVEALPTVIALGSKGGFTPLMSRGDLGVSVGASAEPAAFLISATGNRRTQGRVIWLGAAAATRRREGADLRWAAAVYDASCRHLPLDAADSAGKEAWRKAKERARRLRRVRQ